MKVADYVKAGFAISNDYGKVAVIGAPPRSKTKVDIRVVQRGKGWNEFNEQYERYFVGSSLQKDGTKSLKWGFTNTDEYGQEDRVHINTLKPIK